MKKNPKKFSDFEISKAIEYSKRHLHELSEIESVVRIAFSHVDYLPKLKVKSFEEYVEAWIQKYLNGLKKRPSIKKADNSKTIPDPLLEILLFQYLDYEEICIKKISQGHSFSMRLEMLIGDLLEEYISIKLSKYGWICFWGETLNKIDFIDGKNNLLQIKNSDNTENSSSKTVRNGTTIIKWYRRNSKKIDIFHWDKLNEMLGITDLSELDFRQFCISIIKNNPECVFLNDFFTGRNMQ